MSFSEDEDDFQSADEDGFEDHKKQTDKIPTTSEIDLPDLNKLDHLLSQEKSTDKLDETPKDKTKVIQTFTEKPEKAKLLGSESVEAKRDLESDEEALAERIRERNLKIARKYSMEIAKNVTPSAPIPVHSDLDTSFGTEEIDCSNITDPEVQSSPPPAPPPTPALSSSYNSEDTLSPSSGSGTQYGWRIAPKVKDNQQEYAQSESSSKSDQARVALDRLSESLPQSEKSLFERIAEDVKKVTITAGDRSSGGSTSADANSGPQNSGPAIPLFSELSSSLGGWNWNGASKLLASASQVTSQVGSVLDSVVNKTQNLRPGDQTSSSREADNLKKAGEVGGANSDVNPSSKSQDKAAMSANEASSNDVLVDLTLSAMESLGKKAFGVMTERNESGALQIKGLGRPWEHLLSKKREEQLLAADISDQPVKLETLNEPKTESMICYDNTEKIEQEEIEQKTTLKNRRKRLNYSNDDKLD